ncbi:ribosome maturation factor RimP [Membranihabitans maritimus]|uniref:ribosome maturation factor RimP n=1 Tax=Membranihabitans maritimus TaxID=2904244 RepID=UPI001F46E2E7|nr:ribosome maturation factor [Membranihabitans maritimus]
MVEDKVRKVVEQKIGEDDYNDCYIVEIVYNTSKNHLAVYIDCDSGLTLAKCQVFSRHIESYLDDSLLIGEKYGLDVSSPGVERPLKMVRQYKKNIGRELNVIMTNGDTKTGELIRVSEDEVVLNVKKSKKESVEEVLPFELIKKSLVQIKF